MIERARTRLRAFVACVAAVAAVAAAAVADAIVHHTRSVCMRHARAISFSNFER